MHTPVPTKGGHLSVLEWEQQSDGEQGGKKKLHTHINYVKGMPITLIVNSCL